MNNLRQKHQISLNIVLTVFLLVATIKPIDGHTFTDKSKSQSDVRQSESKDEESLYMPNLANSWDYFNAPIGKTTSCFGTGAKPHKGILSPYFGGFYPLNQVIPKLKQTERLGQIDSQSLNHSDQNNLPPSNEGELNPQNQNGVDRELEVDENEEYYTNTRHSVSDYNDRFAENNVTINTLDLHAACDKDIEFNDKTTSLLEEYKLFEIIKYLVFFSCIKSKRTDLFNIYNAYILIMPFFKEHIDVQQERNNTTPEFNILLYKYLPYFTNLLETKVKSVLKFLNNEIEKFSKILQEQSDGITQTLRINCLSLDDSYDHNPQICGLFDYIYMKLESETKKVSEVEKNIEAPSDIQFLYLSRRAYILKNILNSQFDLSNILSNDRDNLFINKFDKIEKTIDSLTYSEYAKTCPNGLTSEDDYKEHDYNKRQRFGLTRNLLKKIFHYKLYYCLKIVNKITTINRTLKEFRARILKKNGSINAINNILSACVKVEINVHECEAAITDNGYNTKDIDGNIESEHL